MKNLQVGIQENWRLGTVVKDSKWIYELKTADLRGNRRRCRLRWRGMWGDFEGFLPRERIFLLRPNELNVFDY
ncbi:hypothetical protein PanWU01x14_161790 [Parasponia andersonii]|uniref:Uncharacterized protein n=1 Tax=Parasponia andersonii TaxID=3476 RepID=A0A2P5CDD1_PARAD|nr:hypothetical protein PanWU01x14_161790 [Parasponia andersonii]